MVHPWPFIIQGDAESAVVDILKTLTPELVGLGFTITTNLINYDAGDRYIVITQEGSIAGFPKIDRPRIDVEVLAENRTTAKDVAEIAKASIYRQMGHYNGFGLQLCDCRLEMGITRIPDKLQSTIRYLFSLRLTVVPNGTPLVVPPS